MTYAPLGEAYLAQAGSLEHWLTERYCLYARSREGALFRCEVQHAPWPLQRAQASLRHCTLFAPHGVQLPGEPPLLHFSRGVDVVMWNPVRC
jgi:uncharacterized protein YqjF (DUF2071 family)